ncbi:tetratricopeptide repeat protein [Leucothrix pacifica]|uniref:Sel1 repeat family protein n=1 Tax=Leucothrix pacifica TaxID=1247513 RepID=A0A317CQB8_9GAMM|nr:tetratricopeptide repeat protein [Leucothrix pacifica]PWR00585.1 hypothetical protein DKW60_00795 [Leucothrix pacifica]
MSNVNNARVCELYLEYDDSNIEHAKAQLDTKYFFANHHYHKVLDVFMELAEKGDRTFQHNVGVLYHCIEDVRDYQQAFNWYKKAVAQDFAPAKERLACMYEFGDGGMPVDLQAAVQLYKESSDQGNLHSTYNLGMILATGSNCVEKNLPLALSLLQTAAEKGHALMKFNLGIIYLEQCHNTVAANDCFKLAFEQEHIVSVDLGHYYLERYNGGIDCEHSSALSHYWFATAIAYGHQDQVLEIFNGDHSVLNAFQFKGRFH